MQASAELTALPSGYPALLEELKAKIRAAQLRAALTLNQETILLYWSIGQDLSSRFAAEGWGTKVVDRQPRIWGRSFLGWRVLVFATFATCGPLPKHGLTPNFAACCKNCPGGHHMVLLDRLKDGQSGYGISAPLSSMAGVVTC